MYFQKVVQMIKKNYFEFYLQVRIGLEFYYFISLVFMFYFLRVILLFIYIAGFVTFYFPVYFSSCRIVDEIIAT